MKGVLPKNQLEEFEVAIDKARRGLDLTREQAVRMVETGNSLIELVPAVKDAIALMIAGAEALKRTSPIAGNVAMEKVKNLEAMLQEIEKE